MDDEILKRMREVKKGQNNKNIFLEVRIKWQNLTGESS